MIRIARIIVATAIKDIRITLTEPVTTVLGVLIPVNFLLLFMLFAVSGGTAPIAVVMDDHGPLAAEFVSAMAHAHSFRITVMDATQAENAIHAGHIVAVVTVPRDFDSQLASGGPVELPVEVNNLDVDFTNDIRRAVPLSITSFYANAFPGQVVVKAREVDVQPRDTDYVPYLSVSVLAAAFMLAGMLQGGINAAREYETGTVKELLLSPAPLWAISAGKVLGAFLLSLAAAVIVTLVVIVGLGQWPVHPALLLGTGVLMLLSFVAAGALFGTLLRRRQSTIPLGLALFLPLFFVSGPFGPANWLGAVPAALADLSPVYYGIASLQYSFHGYITSQVSLLVDQLIIAGFLVGATGAGALVVRRVGAPH
jgi:ABC-2 type transport system permease protein